MKIHCNADSLTLPSRSPGHGPQPINALYGRLIAMPLCPFAGFKVERSADGSHITVLGDFRYLSAAFRISGTREEMKLLLRLAKRNIKHFHLRSGQHGPWRTFGERYLGPNR